jgi:hypothetical protein
MAMDKRKLMLGFCAAFSVFFGTPEVLRYIHGGAFAADDFAPGGALSVGHDNNGQLCTTGATCNFNYPAPSPKAKAPNRSGDAKSSTRPQSCADCPPGTRICMEDSEAAYGASVGVLVDGAAGVCFVRMNSHDNAGYNYQFK